MGYRDEFVNWRLRSKCSKVDPKHYDKLFFPPTGRVSNKAKDFCRECPVMSICLEDALKNDDEGIRAGTTYKERRAIKKYQNRFNQVSPRVIGRSNLVIS